MGYNSSSGSESLTWKWTITEGKLLPFKSRALGLLFLVILPRLLP